MLDLTKDTHSLTDFKRNTDEFVEQLKDSGEPVVLTIKGKRELIVQDIAAYQKLIDRLDRLEAIEGIRKGLEAFERGDFRPAKEVLEEMRRKYDIPR